MVRLEFTGGFQIDKFSYEPTPTIVEAEDYDTGGSGIGYLDATTGNAGGSYRSDDVDIYPCGSCSNGNVVGYTQTGEWLSYTQTTPTSRMLTFTFKVGTVSATNQIQVLVDGVAAGTVTLPNTGDYSIYQTISLPNISMTAGTHNVRLVFTGGFHIDNFTY